MRWTWSLVALGLAAGGLDADVRDMPGHRAPSLSFEEPLRARAEDVADYTLRASLDPATQTVHGEGQIVWRNRSAVPVGELWLHLYLNAFKNGASAFLRERVGGRGSSGAPAEWGWIDVRKLALRDATGATSDLWPSAELHRPDPGARQPSVNEGPPVVRPGRDDAGTEDETDVRVPLPTEVPPGGEITLEVAFDDRIPSIVERTGHLGRFYMVGQWFPKIARLERDGRWVHFPFHHLSEFYSDFGAYDVTLEVPEEFTIGATGPTVESTLGNHRRVERHVQRDVHDFAWTAWDRFEALHDTVDGVHVTVLHPPGYGRIAQRELAALRFALPYFSSRYGPYPYGVLTLVHPPAGAEEAGGMEYPTLITSEGPWWVPPGVRVPELVTVHELGHQWFYGLVATDEHAWPVLDEGLTQFAEVDALRAWFGPGSLAQVMGLALGDAEVQAVGGNTGVHDEPVAQAAHAFSSGTDYQRLVYARTASLIETLARVHGRDLVARALGVYARRYRFAHPTPDDLLGVFHEVMGPAVAETLRAALFDEGWVDYAVDGVWTRPTERVAGVFDRNGKRETIEAGGSDDGGWDSSVLVRRRGTLSFPVDIELLFADGTSRRERWNGEGPWRRLHWHSPVALATATVDPDDRVLVDANLENNSGSTNDANRSTVAKVAAAPRTLERAAYWMQLALQAVGP